MKFTRKAAAFLLSAAVLAGCSSGSAGTSDAGSDAASGSDVTVGIIQLAEHPALDAATKGFEDYLKENGFDGAKIDYNNANGEASTCTTIAEKLVNNNVNLIYAVATPAALAAANQTKDIPIVVSAVTNPEGSGLVASNDAPGGNVTGASDLNPVEDQIKLLKEILPDAKKISLMYNSAESNSEYQIEMAEKVCDELGLEYQKDPVTDSNTIQQIVESLAGKVDAIYIPTDNLLADAMATVSQAATSIGIPVVCGEENMVVNGGLATYGLDYYELGKLAGAQAVAILNGDKKPAEMAVEYLPGDSCTLALNKKIADQLNLDIPQSVLDRAVVVGEE